MYTLITWRVRRGTLVSSKLYLIDVGLLMHMTTTLSSHQPNRVRVVVKRITIHTLSGEAADMVIRPARRFNRRRLSCRRQTRRVRKGGVCGGFTRHAEPTMMTRRRLRVGHTYWGLNMIARRLPVMRGDRSSWPARRPRLLFTPALILSRFDAGALGGVGDALVAERVCQPLALR